MFVCACAKEDKEDQDGVLDYEGSIRTKNQHEIVGSVWSGRIDYPQSTVVVIAYPPSSILSTNSLPYLAK